jgi:hypothetical protein
MAKELSGDPEAVVQTAAVTGASLVQVVTTKTRTKVNIVGIDGGPILVVIASIDGTNRSEPSLQKDFFRGSGAAFIPPQ